MAAITDPNDPRLSDPAHANDPDVLDYINRGLASQQVASGNANTANTPDWQKYITGASPTPPPVDGGTGGPAGSLPSPFTSTFTPPSPVNLGGPAGIPYIPPTPVFTPPDYKQAPAFNAPAPFKAPSMQDVLSDPGYQFPLTQGLGAISNNRAAKGLWGTGDTGKAFTGYAEDYANQFYGNIYNRNLSTYQTNYGDALSAYSTNYGTQYADPNAYAYKAAQDAFAPQILGYQTQAAAGQHQSDLDYSHAYDKWLADYSQKFGTAGFLRDTAAM